MKTKIYIAAPFFNPEQIERVAMVEELCEKHDIDYFSPRLHNKLEPFNFHSKSARKECFAKNVIEVENCDAIVVLTNGKDMGTIFEAGYAFKNRTPILYFAEGLKGDFNLMLAESAALGIVTDRDQLENSIKLIGMNVRSAMLMRPEYKGSIE